MNGVEDAGVDFVESFVGIGIFCPFVFDEGDDFFLLEEVHELLSGVAVMELEFSGDGEPEQAVSAFGDDGDAAGVGDEVDGESGVCGVGHREGEWIHGARFL